jgi:hypothetical protein
VIFRAGGNYVEILASWPIAGVNMRLLVPMLAVVAACTDPPTDDVDGTDGTNSDTVNDSCAVEVGRCAHDFSLPDTTGALVALSERGGQRVILVGSAMW